MRVSVNSNQSMARETPGKFILFTPPACQSPRCCLRRREWMHQIIRQKRSVEQRRERHVKHIGPLHRRNVGFARMDQIMSIIPHAGVRPLPDAAFTVINGRAAGARQNHRRRRSRKSDGHFHNFICDAESGAKSPPVRFTKAIICPSLCSTPECFLQSFAIYHSKFGI